MTSKLLCFMQSSACWSAAWLGITALATSPCLAQQLPIELGTEDGQHPEPSEPSPAPPPSTVPWRATIELYGPVPLRLDTTTSVVTQNNRSVTTEAVLNLGQILDNLKWITAVRGSVEAGRWGLLTDLSYTALSQENAATSPGGLLTGQAKVNVSQGIYDLAVRYRLGEPETALGTPGQFSVIPYAGLRIIDAQLDVSAQVNAGGILSVQRQGNFGRTWVQPLLGTQATVFLSPRLRAFARADIGGFGLSGAQDLSGNAQVGLGYAVGNSTDLNISWRYFGLDYNNGDNPDSGFSSYQNGLELGLKFFF
jgi:hypothetical protein